MLVYRTMAKKVFWEFDSIIMPNFSDILPLFCTPIWPSHQVSENQGYKHCVGVIEVSSHGSFFRSKLQRDKERDISEQIALGLASAPVSQEALYDQRLFNQSKVFSVCFNP